MKKFKDWGLLPKVLIAIALGIICSFFFPDALTRCFITFNSIFSNFLGLFIPIIILGLIAPGIFELGKGAGRLLLITAAIAYLSTILSGLFSYATCRLTYPSLLGGSVTSLGGIDMDANDLKPYFTIEMPPLMSVTTSLVLAFVLGLSLIGIRGDNLRGVMLELRDMVFLVIRKVIIPILPIFIFGIFLEMGAEGNVGPVLGMFLKIILIIFVMHVTVLVLQFCIAGAIAGKNPFKALVTMLPAYVTALGTQSSAATIPVTRAQTIKNGVDPDVADFVVPLCATIHMSCSILKIVACAYAISLSMGMDISFGTYAGFVLMLGITMIAAPGVPGGAIMAALGLLASMLGFDANMQGLMIALYIAMDSFGTAGNVTGDGAIALIINKIKNRQAYVAQS
ncbi:MAG: dicarboxylate/amino acid:cation symporter [Bacteroidales bacterium]|nr:dicarboxylate/amino acid:cation symporter [Bacteroidales bacterium]MBQ2599380.1 dicarboxylate/amino acid:cation symporter [Bacteroidales bacterium]MBQ4012360.1 dicarboxylate/amino acid:cation symporter [Bacteroidales bacterium]